MSQLLKKPLKIISQCFTMLRRRLEENFRTIGLSQSFKTARILAEKHDKTDSGPAKKEEIKISMPGFVNPETIKEEGYFSQKAKQQLKELKRKVNQQKSLTNAEKKEP